VGTPGNNEKCDHTSVGILVWQNDRLLLVERNRFPFGFAPPSGHLDGDHSFEIAALRELKEEVNLSIINIKLIAEGKMNNKCRREEGDWHYWKIYSASVEGDIKAHPEEIKRVVMSNKEEIYMMTQRYEAYFSNKISEEEWQANPGLEPVWYEWFKILEATQ
jgi:ADP-ribose pyrophosphatase YjhB (NUDIX family)